MTPKRGRPARPVRRKRNLPVRVIAATGLMAWLCLMGPASGAPPATEGDGVCSGMNPYVSQSFFGGAEPKVDPARFRPTFADEFDRFDSNRWRLRDVRDDTLENRTIPTNGELELYVDPAFKGVGGSAPLGLTPIAAKDGHLEITASETPDALRVAVGGARYVSGEVTTYDSFMQQYGLFEIRAKGVKGPGLWTTFWLLPRQGWPPEMDVFEQLGHEPTAYHVTSHWGAQANHGQDGKPVSIPDSSEAFHTYAMAWDRRQIVWYFDGQEVFRSPTRPDQNQPFYMILNLAVGGGGWSKTPDATTKFPATFQVDDVRVYQWAGRCAILGADPVKPGPRG